jgi:(4S)-4-hydroxy-5-phosphonooxypentane-2,3-dione isomerase
MHVTLVHIQVKPENLDEFIEATRTNHEAAVHEPGNLRFDVLQSHGDPCSFILYEAYETPEDAAVHKGAAHYLVWRDIVADWMAEPRRGVVYEGLCP